MSKAESPAPKPYKERVLPSLGSFAAVSFLFPAIALVLEPFNLFIGIVIGLVVTILSWLALVLMAPVIYLQGKLLRVGKAEIALGQLGKIEIVEKSRIFEERGPLLNSAAYRVFQGSVRTALKVQVLDNSDPTPYWLFSSRRPAELAEAIENWRRF